MAAISHRQAYQFLRRFIQHTGLTYKQRIDSLRFQLGCYVEARDRARADDARHERARLAAPPGFVISPWLVQVIQHALSPGFLRDDAIRSIEVKLCILANILPFCRLLSRIAPEYNQQALDSWWDDVERLLLMDNPLDHPQVVEITRGYREQLPPYVNCLPASEERFLTYAVVRIGRALSNYWVSRRADSTPYGTYEREVLTVIDLCRFALGGSHSSGPVFGDLKLQNPEIFNDIARQLRAEPEADELDTRQNAS